jgi:hypothetical protein
MIVRCTAFASAASKLMRSIYSFVGRRAAWCRGPDGEPAHRGDQYLFTALASSAKAILSYRIGRRDVGATES